MISAAGCRLPLNAESEIFGKTTPKLRRGVWHVDGQSIKKYFICISSVKIEFRISRGE